MDFLTKELVDTFSWCAWGEEAYKEVKINGRNYLKFGRLTSAIYVGNLWRVYDPSVKHFKYVLMVGAAFQHPCDSKLDKEVGFEIANERAYEAPIMTMNFTTRISNNEFLYLAKGYERTRPCDFVKTKKEIINEYGEEALEKYNR